MPLLVEAQRADEVVVETFLRLKARGMGGAGMLGRYRFEPEQYIRDRLGWEPWSGEQEQPGQCQVLEAYALALRQQHERDRYESGEAAEEDLAYWHPGDVIQNRLLIEAGHAVGKTKLAAGIVNHFFDTLAPSVAYTFAPSWQQIHDLLWKEIKADRTGRGLPGRMLDLKLERGPDHFVIGRQTSDAGSKGSERVQGQHGKYLLFVLDEAEGIADFVWDSVDSMTSGGISIVLILGNPRTRSSRFHRARELPQVRSFRFSGTMHPNVIAGREIVPGAVRREYVESMAESHCTVVDRHDPDEHTFSLPYPLRTSGGVLEPGTILAPDPEFMFRVLGIAPANVSDKTLIPIGRYEAAQKREAVSERPAEARLGIDVARYGLDVGTVYTRHDGKVHRADQLVKLDTLDYLASVKREAKRLAALEVTSLHVRVDGGGGFGGGLIDLLRADMELREMFVEFHVFEVHFGGTPYAEEAYADRITEMYGEAAAALLRLHVVNPPTQLEGDLCERLYDWSTRTGVAVKRLEPKEHVKKRLGRSPDDGDGFVLAVAPDHLFLGSATEVW